MSQEILLEGDEVIVSSVSPLPPGKVSRRALGRNSCFFLRDQKYWDAILCHSLLKEISLCMGTVCKQLHDQPRRVGVHYGKFKGSITTES